MRPRRLSVFLCVASAVVLILSLTGTSWAASRYFNVASGNFNDPNSWNPKVVPGINDNAYIYNSATATLNTANDPNGINELWVGPDVAATDDTDNTLRVEPNAFLKVGGSFFVGNSATGGTVLQTGGSLLINQFGMSTDSEEPGKSYYSLSGGTLQVDANLNPDFAGTTIIGGGGGTAKFVQSGTGYLYFSSPKGPIYIGHEPNSLGEFTMTSGSLVLIQATGETTQALTVGHNGGRGTFNLDGGAINPQYRLMVGYRGTGVFNQNGGSISAALGAGGESRLFAVGSVSDFTPTAQEAAYGVYNLTGGTLITTTETNSFVVGNMWNTALDQSWESRGSGVFNMTGGSIYCRSWNHGLIVGYQSGVGTFNMSSGTLSARGITVGGPTRRYDHDSNTSNADVWGPPSMGVFNLTGGSINSWDTVTIGKRGGIGELNISNGAQLVMTGPLTPNDYNTDPNLYPGVDPNILPIPDPNGASRFYIGGGDYADANGITNTTRGTLNISGSNTLVQLHGEMWVGQRGGTGLLNLTSGGSLVFDNPPEAYVRHAVSVGDADGNENQLAPISFEGALGPNLGSFTVENAYFHATGRRGVYVGLKGNKPPNSPLTFYPANGTLNIAGTSTFTAPGLIMLQRCDPNIGISKAYVKIGPDANVTLTGGDPNGLLRIYDAGGGTVGYNSATLSMDLVSLTKNSQIKVTGTNINPAHDPNIAGTVILGSKGTLVLNRTDPNYWRPVQGYKFNLIPTSGTIGMTGNFGTVTTTGTPFVGLLKKDANTNWPAFHTEVDANNDLVAVFQGAMLGDCTRDNNVNEADLGDLVSYWKKPGGTLTWENGDFGGNGSVNEADLGDMVSNWKKVGQTPVAQPPFPAPPLPGGAPAAVPEPASLALLALGGLAVRRRRRS